MIGKRRKPKIEWEEKDLKKIGQIIGHDVSEVVAKMLLDTRWVNSVVAKLQEVFRKELIKISGEAKKPGAPPRVTIKEPFINPMEEKLELRPRFSQKPSSQKTSGANVAASLMALKKSQMQSKKLRWR